MSMFGDLDDVKKVEHQLHLMSENIGSWLDTPVGQKVVSILVQLLVAVLAKELSPSIYERIAAAVVKALDDRGMAELTTGPSAG